MTVTEANAVLSTWPARTRKLWRPPNGKGFWLRARPTVANVAGPSLRVPGAHLFTTQPDGMWLYIAPNEYADTVCIEVSNNRQNFADKRSRYSPSYHSLLADVPLPWLNQLISLQHGGTKPRWEACAMFQTAPQADIVLPVRLLRVLYVLPDNLYASWKANHPPTGYEFYCRDSSLAGYNSQAMQVFLRQMSFASHFRTV
jgi:hypothetical protein